MPPMPINKDLKEMFKVNETVILAPPADVQDIA